MEGQILLLLVLVSRALAQEDSRIWSIAVGDDWGAHEYRDDGGFVKGFGPDFLDMVCQEGNMDCRMIWMPYQNCWNSSGGIHPAGGPAIHSRWVEGCSGWAVTVERIHIVKFTQSWMKRIPHYFFVRKGENLNLDNLDQKKIGFVKGWAANEQCVARAITPLDLSQMLHVDTTDQLLDALKTNKIDAVFSTEPGWTAAQHSELTKIDRPLYCTLAGTSIMTRKDSELTAVFNAAFNKIRNTQKFTNFCKEANDKHSTGKNVIECID